MKARQLRRAATEAETKLWTKLRRRQLGGLYFRRQYPIGPYIVDFHCAEAKLAIEVDGGQHAEEGISETDRRRDEWLKQHGLRVIRFWNNQILCDLETVLCVIRRATMV